MEHLAVKCPVTGEPGDGGSLLCDFRTFTHNMLAFGLSKKLCNDFLKKQAVIGNLNEGKALKSLDTFSHLFFSRVFRNITEVSCR